MGFRTADEIYRNVCKLAMELVAEIKALHEQAEDQRADNRNVHKWWQEEKKKADTLQIELEKLKQDVEVDATAGGDLDPTTPRNQGR
jgi:hypothetical protein